MPLAKRARVPVVLHFDHGLTPEKIRRAMDLGFTSIMYDCSTSSFASNCREVAAMVRLAHARGVSVEAELGHVGANDGSAEGDSAGDHSIYTEPLEALKFAQATGVDALAVAIGSGLSDDDFRQAVACGIAKVNIFTDINMASAKTAHDAYTEGAGMTDLMPDITEAVKQATLKKMRVFGSPGHGQAYQEYVVNAVVRRVMEAIG